MVESDPNEKNRRVRLKTQSATNNFFQCSDDNSQATFLAINQFQLTKRLYRFR